MQKINVNDLFRTFALRFSLIYAILVGFFLLVKSIYSIEVTYWVPIVIVVYAISMIVHYVMLMAGKDDPFRFPVFLMISTVLKLLIYGAFCFWIIYVNRSEAVPNITLFFAIYIITTVYEVAAIFKEIKFVQKAE